MNFNIDWGYSLSVVITGLVVVFVVLLLLVGFCMLSGKIFTTIDKNKQDKQRLLDNQKKLVANATANKPLAVVVEEAAPPVVEDGINDETVAAISAAISVIMADDGNIQPFAVKSIKRTKEARPAWKAAGIQENTTVLM